MTRWAVVGASGFVGSAVAAAIRHGGDDVVAVAAPRLTTAARSVSAVIDAIDGADATAATARLARDFAGCEVVVNAAGLATPDGSASDALFGADALLPSVVARAASQAGCRRTVHVSSQSVLGDVEVLTEDRVWRPFSPYSEAKAVGEQALLEASAPVGPQASVIFRALSVQGPGRDTTKRLVAIARSRLAAVAVDAPTPLVHIDSTAAAVVFFGAFAGPVPGIVLQRDDGLTTRSALQALGSPRVRTIPPAIARSGVGALRRAGRVSGRFLGLSRRADLLLFGQRSRADWMVHHGFEAVAGLEAWQALGDSVAAGSA